MRREDSRAGMANHPIQNEENQGTILMGHASKTNRSEEGQVNSPLNKEPEREEKKSFHMVPEYLRMEDECGASTKLEITQGRWKCMICGEWQNYIVANNRTIIGCGAASHSFGGNSVQCCGECAPKGSELLHSRNGKFERDFCQALNEGDGVYRP